MIWQDVSALLKFSRYNWWLFCNQMSRWTIQGFVFSWVFFLVFFPHRQVVIIAEKIRYIMQMTKSR